MDDVFTDHKYHRSISNIFDSNKPIPVEAHLRELKDTDGITIKTVSIGCEFISLISKFTFILF